MSAAENIDVVSARAIAEALGVRKTTVHRRAERESWAFLQRRGNGGDCHLYLRSELPGEIRAALGDGPARMPAFTPYLTARAVDRQRADEAAAAVVAWWEHWEAARRRREPKRQAQADFCAAWSQRHGAALADRTLREWERRYREAGVAGLVPQWKPGRTEHQVPDEFREQFLAYYLQPQRPKLSTCHDMAACVLRAKSPGVRVPSLSSVRRWVQAEVDPQVVIMAREGETAWRNQCAPYIERDFTGLRSNQVWESDHHQLDVWCKGPGKKVVRPWLTAWYDRRSRKCVGWHIFDGNPCSDTILLAFRRGVQSHGVPESAYIDNGKDYRCNAISGGRPARGDHAELDADNRRVQSLFGQLEMSVTFATPYNARAKIIERFFETVKLRFSQLQPAFCGGNPQERPETMPGWDSLPTVQKVTQQFGEWLELDYHRRTHGETGETPADLWASALTEKRTAPEDVLRLAMLKTTELRVMRRNGVELRGLWYDAPELRQLWGRKFFLRYDPAVMGTVDVYDAEDRFVCTATNRAALDHEADHETVRRAIAEQRRLQKEVRAGREAATKLALEGDPLERYMAARGAERGETPPEPEGAKVLRMVAPTVKRRRAAADGAGGEVVDLASRARAAKPTETGVDAEAPSGLAFLEAATRGALKARGREESDGLDE